MLLLAAALVLRLELVRYSLAGAHYRYRQYADETPIVGAEVNVTVRPDGTKEETAVLCGAPPPPAPPTAEGGGAPLSIVNVNGVARYAQRIVTDRIASYIDAETGAVIRVEPLFAGAKPARVFDVNPVEKLNDPTLQDQNNSAAAVPDAAYSTVDLDDVNASGPLGGPWVQIDDLQLPAIPPVDASGSLMFDRSQTGFEDVNAYFQIDRSQRHLQSLGYRGDRGIAQYAVPVDTHAANGADTSFFIPLPETGHGALIFGDGGTDDAEDSDIVVHEYAHAIHEWITPGTFLGPFASEGRAISEGFADYWGFSASYAASVQSGRDPFCFADWDARCWQDASSENCAYPAGADCLRRLDSVKSVAGFDTSDTNGTQYLNGEIWSSALREIFVALTQRYGIENGRRTSDTIAVESLFGAAPNPGFAGIARKMIAADRYLNNGANADVICAAMVHRGILTDCVVLPRRELTLFQTGTRGVAIPDNDPNGVTLSIFVSDSRAIERLYVRVDIAHPVRGDLQIALIAPDGTQVILQNPSADRSPDVRATYGRDSVPVESLDILRGRAAAGQWKLRVSDLRARDLGTLMSWTLVVQFAGDLPLPSASRPFSGIRQFVPVVGHIPGANNTFFRTDVRLLNRGTATAESTLIYTPSGADGRFEYASVVVNIPAGNVVALDDIVGGTFGTEGIGQLEIGGPVVAASRTYTRTAGGTAGEAIMPMSIDSITSRFLPPLFVSRLLANGSFRSNLGVAEVDGGSGVILVILYDAATGLEADRQTYSILPFSHFQIPVHAATAMIAEVVAAGSAQVMAYGSIIDNQTGDATYVAGERPDAPRTVMAPAINAIGALNTQWTTDLWISRIDPANADHPITVTYTDRASAASHDTSATIAMFTSRTYPDAVRLTFNGQGTAGLVTTFLDRGAIAAAVIANASATGRFAQSAPLLELMPPSELDIPFVENSGDFRTNIGLMSLEGALVTVTVQDAAGRTLDTSTHFVAPSKLDQFGVQPRVVSGRVHLQVLSGRIAAYASVVDNVTGDASFVPAR